MSTAYLDSSCVVAAAFGEPGARPMIARRRAFSLVISSTLLEAELFSALRREQCELTDAFHADLALVTPDRALSEEIARVLEAGYLRGADCWHLATALYVAPDPSELTFLTLDLAQRRVAKALGFQV
jgi:predicted nucleic acid-binding protein